MKKKKTKSQRPKKKAMHEILGVIIASLGLFSVFALYFEDRTGKVGPVFSDLLKGLFGLTAYILPVIIITIGILVIIAYHKNINRSKLVLSIAAIFFFLCLLHLFYFPQLNITEGFIEFIKSSYAKGQDIKSPIGTGAICAPAVYLIFSLFGLPGAFIFFISLILVDILLLTNLSLKQLGNNLYNHFKRQSMNRKPRREDAIHICKRKRPFVEEVIPIEPTKFLTDIKPIMDKSIHNEEDIHGSDIKIIDFQKEREKEEKQISVTQKDPVDKTSQEPVAIIPLKTQQESLPYMIPPISLLREPLQKKGNSANEKIVLSNAKLLEDTLSSFGVTAKVIQVSRGPVITRYELQPAPGVKVSRIVSLSDDIALNLAVPGVRIEAPIPGKAAVGVEVPNKDISPVLLREVLESESFANSTSKLSIAIGKDIAGKNIIADIGKMPHVLIAGATGSGKSVCINTLIISILYKSTPEEVKFIMIDPKVVELSIYNGIPHLLIPVVTDPKKAAGALNWAVQEMVSRYKLFADRGARDIERYNELMGEGEPRLPQIVVIIDELADLMMVAPGDVEDAICRLAQMARAAGIHLVIATQRPSVDVITGVIKANIPSRIAFAVSSQIDSRTILDMGGAEKLLGKGDMLFSPVGLNKPVRVQCSFITEKEVEAVVTCIKNQNEGPQYNMDVLEETAVDEDNRTDGDYDELLPNAIEVVIDAGQASISMIQRRLRVGYARAARLIDEMEKRGLVSGFDGSKPRNVLISKEEFELQFREN